MPTIKKKRMAKKGVKKAAPKKATKTEVKLRTVVYGEIRAVVHDDEDPITVDLAKELLGWEELAETDQGVKELKTFLKINVELTHNTINRRIYPIVLNTLKQEILRKRWRFNGEPIIIGTTGQVLNGQHTLLSLILAAHDWKEHPEHYPQWSEEPTLAKLIVYGVEEDDELINTMDTCKPRSLADVIDRANYFSHLAPASRHRAAKMTDDAIKMLWHRTGNRSNAFAVRRTHSESIAYLDSHPGILKAVSHVYEENGKDGRISKRYLNAGYAAAMLYLMAASDTDPEAYFTGEQPGEGLLDLKHWKDAERFWTELAAGSRKLKPVKDCIANILAQDGNCPVSVRWAILTKAWPLFLENQLLTIEDLEPEFVFRDDNRHLAEFPLMGGIDVGEEGPDFSANITEEEVEERKKEVVKKKKVVKFQGKVAQRAGETWAKGDTAWVHNPGGDEPYFGKLATQPYQCTDGDMRVFIDSEDGNWEESLDNLSLSRES